MTTVEELATFAIAQAPTYDHEGAAVAFVLGTNVFVGDFPPDVPNRSAKFEDYGGKTSVPALGVEGISWEYPHIQVVFRGEPQDYLGPRAAAELFYQVLPKASTKTLSGTYYRLVNCLQPPYKLKMDDDRRFYFAFNLEIEKKVNRPA